jgi:hypothetical protein
VSGVGPPFTPGIELSGAFYAEAVRPVLDDALPELPHSAALIGYGSEVLGLDDARSTDHNWGPRVWLFVADGTAPADVDGIRRALAVRLPREFRGYPTNAVVPPGGDARHLVAAASGPLEHMVEISELGPFLRDHLGFDPRAGASTLDWLTTPSQRLAEITGGAVFHDGLGQLDRLRARLAWYPDDIWRLLLAGAWARIGQEEAFVGRTGEVGDELGSRVIAARLVRDGLRLAFLVERRHAPYAKWLGSAFACLPLAAELAPHFDAALAAPRWREREAALVEAHVVLARRTNALGLAAAIDVSPQRFHGRPFTVVGAERLSVALLAAVGDPALRGIAPLGGVDLVTDHAELLQRPALVRRLEPLFG